MFNRVVWTQNNFLGINKYVIRHI